MSLQSGDKVTTNCPRSPRFHNRKGTVVTGQYRGEVGVSFSADENIDRASTGNAGNRPTALRDLRADAYFLPSELEFVPVES